MSRADSGTPARAVRRLLIRGDDRRVVAREDRTLRYAALPALLLVAWAAVEALGLAMARWTDPGWVVLYVALAVVVAAVRPTHIEVCVDRDELACTVRRLALWWLPLRTRRHDLRGGRLGPGRMSVTVEQQAATGGEDSSGLGCLAFLLPFPIGLIVAAATRGGGGGRDGAHGARFAIVHVPALVLRPGEGRPVPLLALERPSELAALLGAVAEVVPEHVEVQ